MPDYDAGFKIVAREAGRELAALAGVACDEWAPVTGEVHAAERLADRAFRARAGADEFIVYMEAYTRWDSKAPWSMLAKSGLLSERERLPCVSLLFVLLPRGYHSQDGTFRLAVADRATQQIWFREVCLWQLEPQSSWEASPGMMALYPLFRHHQTPEVATAQAARAIRTQSVDIIRRADLLTVLAIFSKLATPGFDPLGVIGRQAMKESPLYEQIMQEGREEAFRANTLDLLGSRFGKNSAGPLAEKLALVHSMDDLTQLFHKAIKCRTLGGFRKLLAQKIKPHSAR